MRYKSKRSQACDISEEVREIVWERDNHRCIICGNPHAAPDSHYIRRSRGGLGIEQNITTMCGSCHYDFDHTTQRKILKVLVAAHLERHYPGFPDKLRIYDKNRDERFEIIGNLYIPGKKYVEEFDEPAEPPFYLRDINTGKPWKK